MDLSELLNGIFRSINKRKIIRGSIISLSSVSAIAAIYFSGLPLSLVPAHKSDHSFEALGSFPVIVPTLKYGFALDTFLVSEGKIEPGAFLGDILLRNKVDYPSIDRLVKSASDVFDVRKIQVDKPYMVLTRDSLQGADYFIYEPSVFEYVVFHLKDDLKVERFQREVNTEIRTATGVIESSLWKTMIDQGLSFELADKMEDALQWSIDFHHLQAKDEFKLVYEEKFIKGEPVGIGQVKAAYYKNADHEYYAIYYQTEKESGYYNLEGRPMKTSFLKAPIKHSRISSYYNLNRLHPILKYRRPHYGTDYAAPYGTPIQAVGSGVIIQAGYTSGNGNFIKIRHDDTYTTQYLHMQGFAKGIRTGSHVQQGQVIGYVGSTGLATGPHVCFRFWKNGQQVNHLKLNFPPANPLPQSVMPDFIVHRDQLLALLNPKPAEGNGGEEVQHVEAAGPGMRAGKP